MSNAMPRRDFLKAAPAAGVLPYALATQGCTFETTAGEREGASAGAASSASSASTPNPSLADVRIGSAR